MDVLLIMGTGLLASVASEGISWLFVYRHQKYKSARERILKLQAKLEETEDKSKREALEKDIKALGKELTSGWTTLFVGLMMVNAYGALSAIYDGVVVARLPFEPFSLITGMTHRNLTGSDFREASFLAIYVLSNMAFRTNVQKLLGTESPIASSVPEWAQAPKE